MPVTPLVLRIDVDDRGAPRITQIAAAADKVAPAFDKATAGAGRFKGASEALGGASARLGGILRGLTGIVAGLGVPLGAAGILAGIKSASDRLQDLGRIAERTGISIKQLQAIQFAFKLGDVPVEETGQILQFFLRAVAEAKATETGAREQFHLLGIELKDINSLDIGPLFIRTAEAFRNSTGEAEQASGGAALFGRASLEVINVMRGGAPVFADAARRLNELGIAWGPEQVAQANKFDDQVKSLTEKLTDLFVHALTDENIKRLEQFVNLLIHPIDKVAEGIERTSKAADALAGSPGIAAIGAIAKVLQFLNPKRAIDALFEPKFDTAAFLRNWNIEHGVGVSPGPVARVDRQPISKAAADEIFGPSRIDDRLNLAARRADAEAEKLRVADAKKADDDILAHTKELVAARLQENEAGIRQLAAAEKFAAEARFQGGLIPREHLARFVLALEEDTEKKVFDIRDKWMQKWTKAVDDQADLRLKQAKQLAEDEEKAFARDLDVRRGLGSLQSRVRLGAGGASEIQELNRLRDEEIAGIREVSFALTGEEDAFKSLEAGPIKQYGDQIEDAMRRAEAPMRRQSDAIQSLAGDFLDLAGVLDKNFSEKAGPFVRMFGLFDRISQDAQRLFNSDKEGFQPKSFVDFIVSGIRGDKGKTPALASNTTSLQALTLKIGQLIGVLSVRTGGVASGGFPVQGFGSESDSSFGLGLGNGLGIGSGTPDSIPWGGGGPFSGFSINDIFGPNLSENLPAGASGIGKGGAPTEFSATGGGLFSSLFGGVAGGAGGGAGGGLGGIGSIVSLLGGAGGNLVPALGQLLAGLGGAGSGVLSALWGLLTGGGLAALTGLGTAIGGGFTALLSFLPLLLLEEGGIVKKPTLAMIGEHGPEAVIPLSNGGRSFNSRFGPDNIALHPFGGDSQFAPRNEIRGSSTEIHLIEVDKSDQMRRALNNRKLRNALIRVMNENEA